MNTRLLKLCLHTGGSEVNMDSVRAIVTPPATETHFPLPHGEFVDSVRTGLAAAHLEIVAETHALAHAGNRYFGMLQVKKADMEIADYSLVVGIRNSHDKKFPVGIVAGGGRFRL